MRVFEAAERVAGKGADPRKYPAEHMGHNAIRRSYMVFFAGTDEDGRYRCVVVEIPDEDLPADPLERERLMNRIFRNAGAMIFD